MCFSSSISIPLAFVENLQRLELYGGVESVWPALHSFVDDPNFTHRHEVSKPKQTGLNCRGADQQNTGREQEQNQNGHNRFISRIFSNS